MQISRRPMRSPSIRVWLGAFLIVSLGLLHGVSANETADPLERKVGTRFRYGSFNEAVQVIETKTGYKVRCPKEVADYMQSLFMGMGVGDPNDPQPETQQTVRAFLDDMSRYLSMTWRFDPSSGTIELDHPWHARDERSAAELLQTLSDHDRGKAWKAAFTALVSKPENVDRAWKVLQTAAMEQFGFIPRDIKPVLVKPVISTSLQKYTLVLIEQPIMMYPGHGSASYFCFTPDGRLALAGIMNTGHRCKLVDATVDNEYGARSGAASELHLILKMNLRDFFIARLHLEDHGFKLFSLVDAYGEPREVDGLSVGESMLK